MFVDNLRNPRGPVVARMRAAAVTALGGALFCSPTSGDAQPAADTAPDMDKEEF
ncbi:hypothetical protein [Phenylobacterium sp.]|uniref:hypothetical protein n=1 Tax=Phenylobacterium sp. TaxID=1871053 RepID=UPI0035ADD029